MATKLNKTGLQYYHNRIKNIFATQAALNTLSDRVDAIVAEGGEPNVIESITVNNTPVSPDANKNVALTVPTAVSELTNDGDGTQGSRFATENYVDANGGKIDKVKKNGTEIQIDSTDKSVNITVPTKTSDVQNDGDGQSPFATEAFVGTNGGKIDKIKVNGSEQTITNKEVNITMPTKLSDLTNDGDGTQGSTFPTTDEMTTAINNKLTSVYKAKGSVAFASLPALTAANEGNVYNITDDFTTTTDFVEGAGKSHKAGTNVAIVNVGTEQNPSYKYDVLSGFVDTSDMWTKTELVAITTSEIDDIIDGTSNSSGS